MEKFIDICWDYKQILMIYNEKYYLCNSQSINSSIVGYTNYYQNNLCTSSKYINNNSTLENLQIRNEPSQNLFYDNFLKHILPKCIKKISVNFSPKRPIFKLDNKFVCKYNIYISNNLNHELFLDLKLIEIKINKNLDYVTYHKEHKFIFSFIKNNKIRKYFKSITNPDSESDYITNSNSDSNSDSDSDSYSDSDSDSDSDSISDSNSDSYSDSDSDSDSDSISDSDSDSDSDCMSDSDSESDKYEPILNINNHIYMDELFEQTFYTNSDSF
jgi:hypothetical protein